MKSININIAGETIARYRSAMSLQSVAAQDELDHFQIIVGANGEQTSIIPEHVDKDCQGDIELKDCEYQKIRMILVGAIDRNANELCEELEEL